MSEVRRDKACACACGLFICPIVADSPSNPWRGILARLVLRWSGQGENSYCGLIGLQILPLSHLHSAKTVLAHMWMNNRSAQLYWGVILRCTELCWGALSKNIARGIVACGQIVLQWWQDHICYSSIAIVMSRVVELSSNCNRRGKTTFACRHKQDEVW